MINSSQSPNALLKTFHDLSQETLITEAPKEIVETI